MALAPFLGLFALGLLVGAFGTLIGAGGGFVLVPILLLLYPQESPQTVTSISLAVVALNAGSGTLGYHRLRRIDYAAGLRFAAATVPGALAGAGVNYLLDRAAFNAVFGGILVLVGGYLLLGSGGEVASRSLLRPDVQVTLTDAAGETYRYAYNRWLGLALSVLVGFLSTLLGIGGGIVHVPVMAEILGFPVHIATATSHFVLAVTALVGTAVHLATGEFRHGWRRTAALGCGVVLGAQLGARLSHRVHGSLILRLLGLALLLVGLRLAAGVLLSLAPFPISHVLMPRSALTTGGRT